MGTWDVAEELATELTRFDLETSDLDLYAGQDGDNVEAAEENEASHANEG
jgi:hypothetical protein